MALESTSDDASVLPKRGCEGGGGGLEVARMVRCGGRLSTVAALSVQSVRGSILNTDGLRRLLLCVDGWDVAPLLQRASAGSLARSSAGGLREIRVHQGIEDDDSEEGEAFQAFVQSCRNEGLSIQAFPSERISLRHTLGQLFSGSDGDGEGFEAAAVSVVDPETGLLKWARLGDLAFLRARIPVVMPLQVIPSVSVHTHAFPHAGDPE